MSYEKDTLEEMYIMRELTIPLYTPTPQPSHRATVGTARLRRIPQSLFLVLLALVMPTILASLADLTIHLCIPYSFFIARIAQVALKPLL
jgi:hypothetical protein